MTRTRTQGLGFIQRLGRAQSGSDLNHDSDTHKVTRIQTMTRATRMNSGFDRAYPTGLRTVGRTGRRLGGAGRRDRSGGCIRARHGPGCGRARAVEVAVSGCKRQGEMDGSVEWWGGSGGGATGKGVRLARWWAAGWWAGQSRRHAASAALSGTGQRGGCGRSRAGGRGRRAGGLEGEADAAAFGEAV